MGYLKTSIKLSLGNSPTDIMAQSGITANLALKVDKSGTNHLTVLGIGTATENATELQTTYDLAKAMTPYGAALSATNRVTIEVHPGDYNFGATAFTVNTQFIDIVSTTGNPDVYIHSTESGKGINVTANDVYLKGITTKATTFYTADSLASLKLENCIGGDASFGGWGGTFSGTAINCTGGIKAFGGDGVCSGTVIGCSAGAASFGGGLLGLLSGTATNCTGGNDSFGGSSLNDCGISGKAINCVGGNTSFKSIMATGEITNCRLTEGRYNLPTYPGSIIQCFQGDGKLINWGRYMSLFTVNTPAYALTLGVDSAGKPGAGGLWTVVSDERIKTDIQLADLDICYNTIKNIPLKRYAWADGVYSEEQVKDRHNLGWIAQDVQKYFSKAVSVKPFTKNEKIEDGIEEYQEQDFVIEIVKEEVKEIQIINGVPTQIVKIAEKENKKLLFDEVEVVDENGNIVMFNGTPLLHQMPRMITKTRPKYRQEVIEDCLDLNSGQLIAALYGAVQKCMTKIESLEDEIAYLKNI